MRSAFSTPGVPRANASGTASVTVAPSNRPMRAGFAEKSFRTTTAPSADCQGKNVSCFTAGGRDGHKQSCDAHCPTLSSVIPMAYGAYGLFRCLRGLEPPYQGVDVTIDGIFGVTKPGSPPALRLGGEEGVKHLVRLAWGRPDITEGSVIATLRQRRALSPPSDIKVDVDRLGQSGIFRSSEIGSQVAE
jgi:hypothetical protein